MGRPVDRRWGICTRCGRFGTYRYNPDCSYPDEWQARCRKDKCLGNGGVLVRPADAELAAAMEAAMLVGGERAALQILKAAPASRKGKV